MQFPFKKAISSFILICTVCCSIFATGNDLKTLYQSGESNDTLSIKSNNMANEVYPYNDQMNLEENFVETIPIITNDLGLEDGVSSISFVEKPQYGNVVLNEDYTVTYTPDRNFVGQDQFKYRVCNSLGECGEAYVFVYVDEHDFKPQAVDDTLTAVYYSLSQIDALQNDIDVFDEPIDITITSITSWCDTAFVDHDNFINYRSIREGAVMGKKDSIHYTACDKEGDCTSAWIYININEGSYTDYPIPQIISPNGDGLNDYFNTPEFDNNETFGKKEIIIFNKWGDVVYESLDYNNNWDGIANKGINKGKLVPQDTYYYLFRIEGVPEKLTGYFQVVY